MSVDELLRERSYGLRWELVKVLWRLRLYRKLANYLLAEAQLKAGLPFAVARPYWLILDPNSGCDLHCPFCATGKGKGTRARTRLKWDHFKAVLDELGPYLLHIEFSNWGEPLLNPRIFDMVRYAKSFGVEVHLSTNFNTFSEEAAEKLLDSGLDWLVLSIDGASQETYSRYRVGGDFEKVIANIKTLVAAKKRRGVKKPHVSWHFLVFRHNEHEIGQARRLAYSLGVDRYSPSPAGIPDESWVPVGPGLELYPERAARGQGPSEVTNPADLQRSRKRGGPPRCVWPWIGAAINSNGSLSPCCSVEDESRDYGSVLERGFRRLWNSRNYVAGRLFSAFRYETGRKNACTECRVVGQANMHIPDWWQHDAYESGRHDVRIPLAEFFRPLPKPAAGPPG